MGDFACTMYGAQGSFFVSMGDTAPRIYDAQGSFFDSMGCFAPTTHWKNMMTLVAVYLFVFWSNLAIVKHNVRTSFIDKVIKFHDKAINIDKVMIV